MKKVAGNHLPSALGKAQCCLTPPGSTGNGRNWEESSDLNMPCFTRCSRRLRIEDRAQTVTPSLRRPRRASVDEKPRGRNAARRHVTACASWQREGGRARRTGTHRREDGPFMIGRHKQVPDCVPLHSVGFNVRTGSRPVSAAPLRTVRHSSCGQGCRPNRGAGRIWHPCPLDEYAGRPDPPAFDPLERGSS